MTAAAARFSANNTDPKAVIIPAYQYGRGSSFAYIVLFYDGPAPPPGVFDDWLAIPSLSSNLATRDFASLIQSLEMITPIDPGVTAVCRSLGHPGSLRTQGDAPLRCSRRHTDDIKRSHGIPSAIFSFTLVNINFVDTYRLSAWFWPEVRPQPV